MPIRFRTFTFALSLLLGALFFLGSGMSALASKSKTQVAENPICTLNVDIEVDQRDILFKQLKLFSEKHAFAIRIAPTTPDEKSFISQLWREDVKIAIVNPFEEGKYKIYFYKNSTAAVQQDVLKLLVSELKSFLAEIPNVVITEPPLK